MTHKLPNWYFNALCHHGIIGQRWGVRRFQDYDGTRIKTSDVENQNHLGKFARSFNGNMPRDEYKTACEYWDRVEEIDASERELSFVKHQFNNHLTEKQRRSAFIDMDLHLLDTEEYNKYYAINKGFGDYKIYRKVPIDDDVEDAFSVAKKRRH